MKTIHSLFCGSRLLLFTFLGILTLVEPGRALGELSVSFTMDESRVGHELWLLDHNDNGVWIGNAAGIGFSYSYYQNSVTLAEGWRCVYGDNYADPYPWETYDSGTDPENANAANWQLVRNGWDMAQAQQSFDPTQLDLKTGSKYTVLDAETGQLSDSYWVDEGFERMIELPGLGLPPLPAKVIDGKLKVLGEGQFKSKVRFDAPVRIAPAGDLLMGDFHQESAN